jgi:hypothetical protein
MGSQVRMARRTNMFLALSHIGWPPTTEMRGAGVVVTSRSSVRFAAAVLCLTLVLALTAGAGHALGAVGSGEAECSAVTRASGGYQSFLPDCRAYELVTPPYKGGWPLMEPSKTMTVSPDGSSLIGVGYGGFAGAENDEDSGSVMGAVYRFSRTPTGWTSTPLDPPAAQAARSRYVAASADLASTLWSVVPQARENEEVVNPRLAQVLDLRESGPEGDGRLVDIGPEDAPVAEGEPEGEQNFLFAGASRDLTHIVFSVASGSGQLWQGDTTREGSSLYEYVGVHHNEPTLVGIHNDGPPPGGSHVNEEAQLIGECGVELGGGRSTGMYNAISADGSVVYFTALHGECATPAVDELYARIGGSRTVAISEPELPPGERCTEACAHAEPRPAAFQGASEDGRRVFFTTTQPLLNSDRDVTNDLYEAEIGARGIERLVLVSSGERIVSGGQEVHSPGEGAEVVGVARVSEDGSRVYYVARGVLTEHGVSVGVGAGESEQRPEAEALNLYVYDTQTERTSFVANLMTSEGIEPVVEQAVEELVEAEKQAIEQAIEAEKSTFEADCESLPEPDRAACVATKVQELEARKLRELEVKVRERKLTKAEELLEKLWAGELPVSTRGDFHRSFETTRDGRFAIFLSARDLTPDDTSTVDQLFEYDAQREGLVRVSIGQHTPAWPQGVAENGNIRASALKPVIATQAYREMLPTEGSSSLSLTEDGRVFFTSQDALTPQASPESENIYEYNEGDVFLISPGLEASPRGELTRFFGADETGANVFFQTTDPLVPQDTDSQADWYDARENGGFPELVLSPPVCTGGCQGALEAPSATEVGGSAIVTAEGGLRPPSAGHASKHRKPKQRKRQKRPRRKPATKRKRSMRARGRRRRRG